MPPKAPAPTPRGGRSRGYRPARGRGRGRGEASQPTQPPTAGESDGDAQTAPPDAAAQQKFPAEDPTNPLEFSGLPLETSAAATPQQEAPLATDPGSRDVPMQDAPPTVPATASPAPAPIPSAAPGRTTSMASPAPSNASAALRGARRGGISAMPNFGGRRTKAQRDADKAEADARKAAETKAQMPPPQKKFEYRRGDGKPGRARGGGYMGDRSKQQVPTRASGPFSAGMVNNDYKRRSAASGSSGGGFGPSAQAGPSRSGGGGGGGGSGGAGSSSAKVRIKTEDGLPGGIISNDIGGSTDLLWSDDENTDGEAAGPSRFVNIDDMEDTKDDIDLNDPTLRSMLPVRPKRQERQPKGQAISVTKSSKLDRKRAMRNLDPRRGKARATDDADSYAGVYSSEDYSSDEGANPEVKQEPGTLPSTDQATKDKKPRNRRPAGPDLQTPEERAEHARHLDGLEMMVAELGPSPDDDVTVDNGTADHPADLRADKVYLFQFPPVLPDLLTAAEQVKPEAGEEADAPEVLEAVKEVEAAKAKGAKGADVGQAEGSKDAETSVKPDPDAVVETTETKPARPGAKLSSGAVGKLRVHASGKVTIDWGGTALQMGLGTRMDFLQEVVVVKASPEERSAVMAGEGGMLGDRGEVDAKSDVKQADGVVGGDAWCMGQVRGRFVVTPDWDEIV